MDKKEKRVRHVEKKKIMIQSKKNSKHVIENQ